MPVKTTCYESLDKTKLTELINCNNVTEQDKVTLTKLKRKRVAEVKYMYGADEVSGITVKRMSAQGTSIFHLSKIARDYLTSGKYKELDISNCAMGILNDLCKKEDVVTETESNFINNLYTKRDELFETHAEKTILDHKKTYLSFLFGNARPPYVSQDEHKSYKVLRSKICELKKYSNISKDNEDKPNPDGKTLAAIIFGLETEIMLTTIDYLKENDINYIAIIYDGVLIDKNAEINADELVEFINERTGHTPTFKIKEIMPVMIDTDNPEPDKETIIDIIYDEFINWGDERDYVRVHGTETVIKLLDGKPYAGTVEFNDIQDTLESFQSSLAHTVLFKGQGYTKKRENIISILKTNCPTEKFPCKKTDCRYFGYSDGVLDIYNNKFIKLEDWDGNELVRKYFDIPYPGTNFVSKDLETVFDYQNFNQETKDGIYFMIGRMFYPIGTFDQHGLVLVASGATTTGKSTILDAITSVMEKNESVGTRPEFALYGKNKKELLHCNEAEHLFSYIREEQFKSMARGETVEIEGKGKDKTSEKWTTPMCFCAQNPIVVKDKSGAIHRQRLFNIRFLRRVKKVDKTLAKRIAKEFPKLIPFLIDTYHKNIHTFTLPTQVAEWNDEITDSNNYFAQWLNTSPESLYTVVEPCEKHITKYEALYKAWKNHWQYTLGMSKECPQIGDNEIAALDQKDIYRKIVNTCRVCRQKWSKKDCRCESGPTLINRTSSRCFIGCKIIKGGQHKDSKGYHPITEPGEED